jgi:hypothetical protein
MVHGTFQGCEDDFFVGPPYCPDAETQQLANVGADGFLAHFVAGSSVAEHLERDCSGRVLAREISDQQADAVRAASIRIVRIKSKKIKAARQ